VHPGRCCARRRSLHPRLAISPASCARAAAGRTRLFLQLIDFLRIRRRPIQRGISGSSEDHGRDARRIGSSARRGEVRARPRRLDGAALADVLSARELERNR